MRKKLILALLVVAAGGAVAWTVADRYYPVHHWAVVHPGVLYRSGQPDAGQIRRLARRYHIRTVVNLRAAERPGPWLDVERRALDQAGVARVDIAMGRGGNAAEHLLQFLNVATSSEHQPVWVHCEAGSARTGYAVAGYRIAVQRWSYEAALAEAKRLRFDEVAPKHSEYVAILKALAAGADWRVYLPARAAELAATQAASAPSTQP